MFLLLHRFTEVRGRSRSFAALLLEPPVFPPDSWKGMRTLKPDGHESAKSPRLLLRAVFICDRELRESLSDG